MLRHVRGRSGWEQIHRAYDRPYPRLHKPVRAYEETLEPIRTRRKELEKDPGYVMDVLRQGTEVAQAAAADTLAKVKHAMQIDYFA